MQYHKIETAFVRDESFKVTQELRHPVYGDIKKWRMSEKIDGTNVRIMLTEEGKMKIGGKSDEAQLHAGLYDSLLEMFSAENLKEVFWAPKQDECVEKSEEFVPFPVILYGEGYGAGIQKGGGDYNANKTFRLFDVWIKGEDDINWWLDWQNVEDVAKKLSIKTVPDMGWTTLEAAVAFTKIGFDSIVAKEETGIIKKAEGVVLRPRETMYDKAGRRIIIKLKTQDFATS